MAENTTSAQSRLEKLKELRRKKNEAEKQNRRELAADHNRKDDKSEAARARAAERAEFELAKLEALENNEDFERRRAWDWTIEEAESWDEKMKEKAEAKAHGLFHDYTQAAERAYIRDMKDVDIDKEAYLKEKLSKVDEKDLAFDDHRKVVVLKDEEKGVDFDPSRPPAEAISRLKETLKKEDTRKTKRRKRPDDGDELVTYINEKNRQFNKKLSRHYDKYTKDIKDSYERGTAI